MPTPPNIIGLSGYARSGKDTVAGFLHQYGYGRIAFADKIRDAMVLLDPIVQVKSEHTYAFNYVRLAPYVEEVGWEEAKSNPDVRRLLQRMGTEVGRDIFNRDIWVQLADLEWEKTGYAKTVITDVRFANEANWIRRHNGVLWRVSRPGTEPALGHKSDTSLDEFRFDMVIPNDDSLEYLEGTIASLMSGFYGVQPLVTA